VLLVRDYGIWAWAAFAVPNMIGAGAVGWLVRDAAASRRLVRSHLPAFIAFSWVTIAFQVFFVVWILGWFYPRLDLPHVLLLLACAVAIGRPTGGRIKAWIVLPLSYAIGIWALHRHWIPMLPPAVPASIPRLGGLAAACMLGFGLCPYLDLTFHLARQRTSVIGGRIAFTLGFGLFFLGMLLFTLGYSGYLTQPLDQMPPTFSLLLPLYLVIQASYTIGLHLEALNSDLGLASGRGELIYRLFMGGYGLFFPAFIWMRMRTPARSPKLVIGAIVLASPFIAYAFLSPPAMAWALPGVLIVLLAGLLRGTARQSDANKPAAPVPA